MSWLVFAALTCAALLSVIWPLLRAPRGRSRRASDIAFYEAQLAAIDADAAGGLVASHDAEGARAAAARRLIAAGQDAAADRSAPAGGRVAIVAAAACVAALSIGLYSVIGRPLMPDQPLAARLEQPPEKLDIMAAIGKIEAHLAKNPDEPKGYRILAPIYMRLGRYEDAARAYAADIRLEGADPERLSLYGEALVAAADGDVTDQAKKAFQAAAAGDPAAARPRFYLGLSAAQAGDKDGARAIWSQLLEHAPPEAPFVAALRARLAALNAPEAGAGDASGSAPQRGPAQNPSLAAKVAALDGPDQARAIRGMVDNLASRLAQDGRDVEGWLRLVRAYVVLHEADKARSAVADAKRSLAEDATASARIDALARELGLEG